MTGFETSAESVAAHGAFLNDSLAPGLREAVGASHVSLGADVMGVICQVYSFVFEEELADARNLVATLPEAMQATGNRLQEAAEAYTGMDQAGRDRVRSGS